MFASVKKIATMAATQIGTYYEEQGIFPVGGTQQEFAAHIQNQITTWGELIKETGISLQQSP